MKPGDKPQQPASACGPISSDSVPAAASRVAWPVALRCPDPRPVVPAQPRQGQPVGLPEQRQVPRPHQPPA